MSFLGGLVATAGGAAGQRVKNYENEQANIERQSELDKQIEAENQRILAQQNFERPFKESQQKHEEALADYEEAGVGLRGAQTDKTQADIQLTKARTRLASLQGDFIAGPQTKLAIARADRERYLDQYDQAQLQEKYAALDQRGQEFAQGLAARINIANAGIETRLAIASMATQRVMYGEDLNAAVREAQTEYTQGMANYRAQLANGGNPGAPPNPNFPPIPGYGGAAAPSIGYPNITVGGGGGGGQPVIIYNGQGGGSDTRQQTTGAPPEPKGDRFPKIAPAPLDGDVPLASGDSLASRVQQGLKRLQLDPSFDWGTAILNSPDLSLEEKIKLAAAFKYALAHGGHFKAPTKGVARPKGGTTFLPFGIKQQGQQGAATRDKNASGVGFGL